MRRDKISIEDGKVTVTGGNVWMTPWEIAELFNSTIPRVRSSIKAMQKTTALKEHEHCRRIRLENGLFGEAYSMEAVTYLSFVTDTYAARQYRKWLHGKALSNTDKPPCKIISINGYKVYD